MGTKQYYIYIMASQSGVLYTGITSDLRARVYQHKSGTDQGFTARYRVRNLVYFESTPDVYSAIAREKQIKDWRRSKKVELIDSSNPEWRDLSAEWEA